MTFDEEGEEIVCISNTILNHQNKQKMFKIYSYCKKEKESSESPLTMDVYSHSRNVKKRSGG